jgi:hypothetical protein
MRLRQRMPKLLLGLVAIVASIGIVTDFFEKPLLLIIGAIVIELGSMLLISDKNNTGLGVKRFLGLVCLSVGMLFTSKGIMSDTFSSLLPSAIFVVGCIGVFIVCLSGFVEYSPRIISFLREYPWFTFAVSQLLVSVTIWLIAQGFHKEGIPFNGFIAIMAGVFVWIGSAGILWNLYFKKEYFEIAGTFLLGIGCILTGWCLSYPKLAEDIYSYAMLGLGVFAILAAWTGYLFKYKIADRIAPRE